MYRLLSILVVAVLAMTTLAAPAPSKTISKRSFAAKVKGRRKLSGAEALQRAARKYGFEVSIPETDDNARRWDFDEAFSHHHEHDHGSDFSWPSGLAQLLSSLEGFSTPAPSASAAPSGFGGNPSGFSVVPSSPASSSVIASSGAPPSQSSAPAPHGSAPAPAPSASASASASAPAPSSSSAPGSGDETGEVSADPAENESMYLSPVTIGGNQKLNLDFDTGSSDLWVFDAQANSGHTAFDPSKSKTFQTYQGGSWQIQYGDGSKASGSVGFDTVTIGSVTAQKQCVELAQQVSKTFVDDVNNDGLLGLGFSSINQVQPQQQKTFFENIMGDLEQPLFTADLEEDNSGTYEFGKIDSSKYSGSLHYTPIDNSQGWWMFQAGSFAVGGSQHDCNGCNPAIVDTGTSLLILDDQIVQAYYDQVQGATLSQQLGGYVYPCSTTPPDFGVAIGGYTATIKGADMTYADAGSGQCYGGIQPGGSSAGVNILGDVFLKQFFVVFDGGNLRVGVAPK